MRDTIDMANETLDRMAPDHYCREPYWSATDEELKAFESLVRADEREACAALAEKLEWADNKGVASAIRARGQA